MSRTKIGLGQRGEALAAQAIQRRGLSLVARNWRCPYGEADLIARRADHLYFIEVRTRRGDSFPTPEQSLTPRKRARMEAVARAYLGAHTFDEPISWHLSFIAIAIDSAGHIKRITFYPDIEGEPEELLPST